jgi:hypothetical protein
VRRTDFTQTTGAITGTVTLRRRLNEHTGAARLTRQRARVGLRHSFAENTGRALDTVASRARAGRDALGIVQAGILRRTRFRSIG